MTELTYEEGALRLLLLLLISGDSVTLPCSYNGELKKETQKVEGKYSLTEGEDAGKFELII